MISSTASELEAKLSRKVVNDHGEIDEELEPKACREEGEVGFSVTHKGKERFVNTHWKQLACFKSIRRNLWVGIRSARSRHLPHQYVSLPPK